MPDPRTIAEEVNSAKNFEPVTEATYDTIGGHPRGGKNPSTPERAPDYAVHPKNPPPKPLPAKNLSRG
jgi:hypothetical protein